MTKALEKVELAREFAERILGAEACRRRHSMACDVLTAAVEARDVAVEKGVRRRVRSERKYAAYLARCGHVGPRA